MQKLTAIILSSCDIGEFDRIYILYTRETGLVKAVGRGVRKQAAKLVGHLEPGTLSEVYVARARGMGQITSAITISNFENIRKSFEKLKETLKLFRFFTRNFSEGEKDEKIFDLMREFLSSFAKATEDKGNILVEAFWWKFFDLLGHRPDTMKCAKCAAGLEEKKQNFFSAAKGGTICEKCSGGERELMRITPNQIKLLRIFLVNPLGKVVKVKIDEKELRELGRTREEFKRYNF